MKRTTQLKFLSGMTLMLAVLFQGVPVEASEIDKAVSYRQGLMNVFSWNMKAMGSMIKGKTPYDQKKFSAYAQELALAAQFDLMSGFPEDSESDESDALSEIWLDFDDFKRKYQTFAKAATALSEVASRGDKARTNSAFKEAGKQCKACHKKYKN
jgi:cytochrome c556